MDKEKLAKLEALTLYLHFDLAILNSAIKCDDGDLQIYGLEHFVDKIYQNSEEIRKIFAKEL
jgi:hypothetical protein